jgi:hypothetical protein
MPHIITITPRVDRSDPVEVVIFAKSFSEWRDEFLRQLRESPWLRKGISVPMSVFLYEAETAKNEDEFEAAVREASGCFDVEVNGGSPLTSWPPERS